MQLDDTTTIVLAAEGPRVEAEARQSALLVNDSIAALRLGPSGWLGLYEVHVRGPFAASFYLGHGH